jgi:single-stranded DNA-binding protein
MSLYASGVVRIISDPQLKSFESGNVVVNFAGGIAEGKDKDGNYINNAIDVEIWGKSAEIVYDKLKKGDSLFVTGNIRRNEWATRMTPELEQACSEYPEVLKLIEKRSKHSLSVARFEFLPRPKMDDEF